MSKVRLSLTALGLFLCLFASAKEVTDTLYSAKNDRIIITYSVSQKGNQVELQFIRVKKALSSYLREKYKETDKIHTLFSDWAGTRKDIKFTGETPSVITFPANTEYTYSPDGYFIIEQRPLLSFKVETAGEAMVSIPIYLAHYEKKQHYKILYYCGDLKVNLNRKETASEVTKPEDKPAYHPTERTMIEIEEEIPEISEFDDRALKLIDKILSSLPNQKELPMESTLEKQVEILVGLQPDIKNDAVSKRIDETLEAFNDKKKELEEKKAVIEKEMADNNAFTSCNTKEDYERYLKQNPNGKHVEEAKKNISELDEKAKEDEKNKNKRTIWMIIGGALLAILLFVGNQVLQSFRNIRTQRSIMQMQQDATKRAENMAKSKARNEIRKQTNKVVNQAKQKGQTALRNTANNATKTKGNKRVSI